MAGIPGPPRNLDRIVSFRHHPSYVAFAVHRLSGLCLAAFLPIHLYVLSLLLSDPAKLDGFLSWTQTPVVKLCETLLILLAAIHLTGGVRILVYELFNASPRQSLWIASSLGISVACALIFLGFAR